MFRHILLAYDGSPAAEKAFAYALDLTAKYGAQLHVLAVARPPEIAEDVETEAMLEQAKSFFEKDFTKLREHAAQVGLVLDCRVHVGHPAEQVVVTAEEMSADLIITGHRGQGLFERWLLGSVSRLVVAYAHCPVLIVR